MISMGPSSNKNKVHEKEAQMPIACIPATSSPLHHQSLPMNLWQVPYGKLQFSEKEENK